MADNIEQEAEDQVANKANVRDGLASLRAYKRRTVVWPATMIVNEFEFKCMLYDISLGGVRLKLDLPLAAGATVSIKIKDFEFVEALVSWHAEGFVGLKFINDVDYIAEVFGDYANSLM